MDFSILILYPGILLNSVSANSFLCGDFRVSLYKVSYHLQIPGYKINIEKFIAFFTLIMQYQKERVQKQSCLKSLQKIIKYLRINITKAVMDLDVENYKTLIKEIEKKRKDTPYS